MNKTVNKKAYYEYNVLRDFTAGIQLFGSEVKSMRANKFGMSDSYCYIWNNEIFLKNFYISKYDESSYLNHEERRDRKLLLHKKEIREIIKLSQDNGTTIILTTHYIEEAEEMADRIGIIHSGELIMVDNKSALMTKLGKKELTLELQNPLLSLPKELDLAGLSLSKDKHELTYRFDSKDEDINIAQLLQRISNLGIVFKDLHTKQSSLEEIFVNLVNSEANTHEV
jgi:SsrA-binding protein